jgi:hypothetical protein
MAVTPFPPPASRPLEGRALLLARSVWLVLVALQLVSFVPLLPAYLPLAQQPCPAHCLLTAQQAQSLTSAGISPTAYVGSLLVVAVLNVLLATTIAGILFVRRSHEVMALIAAYFVLILPTSLSLNSAPIVIGANQTTAFTLPLVLDLALGMLQTATIYGMLLLFPSGRFVPRWSWALLLGFVAYSTVWSVWPQLQDALVLLLGWPLFLGSAGACIGYRYRRVSTPRERQQTKWVIFGFLVFLLTSQAYWLPTFTPLGTTVYAPLAYLGYQLFLSVVPITFFVAIQRYRLYDIDTIIRRTLVYGSLTAILVAIYVVGVVGAQALVGRVAGQSAQQEPILIVVTTLVIVRLFEPLRRVLQQAIDRRFYRTNYDAERTVATFGAALRSEVDLDHLRDHLVAVVEETMHPAQVSLWVATWSRSRSRSLIPPPDASVSRDAGGHGS